RRRVMITADLLRALAVGSIPLLYATRHLHTAALAAAMFSLATGTTLFNPAIKAFISEITPPAHLTGAVSLFQISEFTALVLGPAHVATPLLVKETLGLGTAAYARAQTFFFLGLLIASATFWALGRRAWKGPTILIGIMLDGLTFIPLAFCHTLGQVQMAL